MVRHHRPARRRQDHGAAERRAALHAGRADGPRRGRGRRRHPAVRMVVHRRRRADRHGRALHHAGFGCRGRPRRLGGLPGAAEAHPAAPAAERGDRRHRAAGRRAGPGAERDAHAAAIARRIAELESGWACACRSMRCSPRPTCSPGSPSSSTTWTREGGTRSGARPSRYRRKRRPGGAVRRRVPRPVGAAGRAHAAALQAEHRPDRRGADRRLPDPVRQPGEAARQLPGRRLRRRPRMLRGVYFASGTQEGTPIDRLTGAMSRAFGIDQREPRRRCGRSRGAATSWAACCAR